MGQQFRNDADGDWRRRGILDMCVRCGDRTMVEDPTWKYDHFVGSDNRCVRAPRLGGEQEPPPREPTPCAMCGKDTAGFSFISKYGDRHCETCNDACGGIFLPKRYLAEMVAFAREHELRSLTLGGVTVTLEHEA